MRRQGDAFHRAGWEVVGFGLPAGRSAPPEWRIAAAPDESGPRGARSRSSSGILRRMRRLLGRIVRALGLLAVRLWPCLAQPIYWSFSEKFHAIYGIAARVEADIWLANDWTMLPVAARLAREKGVTYGYDTHEFATEEYGDRRKWRLLQRPLVCALEGAFIREAVVVSAVSDGIAERLDALYALPRGCIVVRNTPVWEETPWHATGEPIRVLYHGILAPGRGLEATIDSVALWRPEFDLTLRGPGAEPYLDELRARIERVGLTDRVQLAPPVPMTALVREAAAFDIGFFALPGSSRHNEFALPNKFFEYLMAGLALCVTDLPEMGRLIRQYDLGVTLAKVEPLAIAAAINGLDRARIDAYKKNALRAARELCWERESGHLVAAYAAAVERAAG